MLCGIPPQSEQLNLCEPSVSSACPDNAGKADPAKQDLTGVPQWFLILAPEWLRRDDPAGSDRNPLLNPADLPPDKRIAHPRVVPGLWPPSPCEGGPSTHGSMAAMPRNRWQTCRGKRTTNAFGAMESSFSTRNPVGIGNTMEKPKPLKTVVSRLLLQSASRNWTRGKLEVRR